MHLSSFLIKIISGIDALLMNTILGIYSKENHDFFFIEIGASDNIETDHIGKSIFKFNWRGIIVEPVPYLFEKLTRNYGTINRLIFENVAIAEENCERDFYYVSGQNSGISNSIKGIGSFSIDHIHKFNFPRKEKDIVSQKIKCLTFEELIRKHEVKKLDLLQIDTEGYDYKILKTINFERIKPKILHYEFCHLNKEEQLKSVDLLQSKGYIIIRKKANILAFLKPGGSLILNILIGAYRFLSFIFLKSKLIKD